MYPSNDLTSINNGSTPRGEDHTKHSKRKQTILTLLDVLNELRDGELADASTSIVVHIHMVQALMSCDPDRYQSTAATKLRR